MGVLEVTMYCIILMIHKCLSYMLWLSQYKLDCIVAALCRECLPAALGLHLNAEQRIYVATEARLAISVSI
jgi:hypothetical protein